MIKSIENYSLLIEACSIGQNIAHQALNYGFKNISYVPSEQLQYAQHCKDHILKNKHQALICTFSLFNNNNLVFEEQCLDAGMLILRPIITDSIGLLTVISPQGLRLSQISQFNTNFTAYDVIKFYRMYLQFWGEKPEELKPLINKYKPENVKTNTMDISAELGKLCAQVLIKIATNKTVRVFPEFYTILDEL